MAQRFVGSCQNALELWPRGRILCKLPRLIVRDELVHAGDPRPCGFERPRKVQRVEFLVELSLRVIYPESDVRGLFIPLISRKWRDAAEIVPDHRKRAACQIPQAICKIRVHPIDQSFVSHFAVLTESHLAKQVVSNLIVGEVSMQNVELNSVAHGLAHLLSAS